MFWHAGSSSSPVKANYMTFNEIQDRILDGTADLELNPNSQQAQENQHPPNTYFPRGSDSCSAVNSSNVRVNQACLNVSDPDLAGRGQAQNETAIAQDPNNPNHVVAEFNNYQRGDGNCIGDYSLDKGKTWNDVMVPMSFTRGRATFGAARQYWQAGGDPSVAWDSKGNAYFACQVFERGRPPTPNPDLSSAVYVYRSTQNNGASFNFPGRPVVESADLQGSGVPDFEDKPYMTVDNNSTACPATVTTVQPGASCTPFQDRIYVTWTIFRSTGSAYIFESYSSDYGEHFSSPHLVSVNAPILCPQTFGAGTEFGSCNENQFSQPFVSPDGTLYVVYDNYNNAEKTASDDRNQVLISKSIDGGNTFVGPIKVSDYYDLPDCATYQGGKDFGRACVPEKNGTNNSVFRATNYPVGAVNPTNPSQVVVTFGSYINKHSNEANGCVPAGINPATGNNLFTGVKTPGACNNDILVSVSNDAGATFTGTTTDPRALPSVGDKYPGQAVSDQFWQWEAFTKTGKLAVSYFDREYDQTGSPASSTSALPFDEATGYSDVTLSASKDTVNFNAYRVTSSPMPPPTQFGGTFYGDYSGLSAVDDALPLWMDTRNPELFVCMNSAGQETMPPSVCTGKYSDTGLVANDQDAYTSTLPVSAP